MVAGRWVLLALMVVVGPLLWLVGVADAAAGALAVVAPDHADERYFISNYAGPGRTFTGLFALINLAVVAGLLPSARRLRTRRIRVYVRAVAASIAATGVAYFEYTFDPVTANWGGDPDGWSLVRPHVALWNARLGAVWMTLVAVTAVVVAVLAVAAAVRQRRRPADSALAG